MPLGALSVKRSLTAGLPLVRWWWVTSGWAREKHQRGKVLREATVPLSNLICSGQLVIKRRCSWKIQISPPLHTQALSIRRLVFWEGVRCDLFDCCQAEGGCWITMSHHCWQHSTIKGLSFSSHRFSCMQIEGVAGARCIHNIPQVNHTSD